MIKQVIGIILIVIGVFLLLPVMAMIFVPSDGSSVKVVMIITFIILGGVPLFFGIRIVRSSKGNKSATIQKAMAADTAGVGMAHPVETMETPLEENKMQEKEKTEKVEDIKNTFNEENSSYKYYDDIKIYYENMSGEKNWHSLLVNSIGKNWRGEICLYADGRDGEDITFNLKRILKVKSDDEVIDTIDYFNSWIEGFEKIISDHKAKVDGIIRAMEGFEDAKIFHCSIGHSLAISTGGIVAIFSKSGGIVERLEDVKRVSFNKTYLKVTIYFQDKGKVGELIITYDFGDPLTIFNDIKEALGK